MTKKGDLKALELIINRELPILNRIEVYSVEAGREWIVTYGAPNKHEKLYHDSCKNNVYTFLLGLSRFLRADNKED